jgi:hypothetical protein
MSNYAITERGGRHICEVPDDLVKALQSMSPEQMQEVADAAVCLGAGLIRLEEVDFPWWEAELADGRLASGDTRAEALHNLAEQVRAKWEAARDA